MGPGVGETLACQRRVTVPTELVIINKSLDDIMRRLEAAPQTPTIQQLAVRARAFRRVVNGWRADSPSQVDRSFTVQRVLGIQIALMEAGIQSEDTLEVEPDSASEGSV
jgi:hypothetical protein